MDDDFEDMIRSTMTRLTRDFEDDTGGIEDKLAAVTTAAVNLINGVDDADVLLIKDGQFHSVTPTSALTIRLDAAQQTLGEGPCLAAAVTEAVIRCPDLRNDLRWPRFGAVAVEAGVLSMLSYQLYSHRGEGGALNLFGRNAQSLNAEAEAIGAMLATHAAIVLIAANRQHEFESALASRDVIGQAKGMIMERFQVDATRAFELLTRVSQDTNTPVRIIAQEIIDRRLG